MKILAISSSLNPKSRSAHLLQAACADLEKLGQKPDVLDLTTIELPFCDGGAAYEHKNVPLIQQKVAEADGILIATPVYNYNVNAALKNFIELSGAGWEDKAVGFLVAAGGQNSYMAVTSFAVSLMLEYRCFILPRYVFATGKAFSDDGISDPDVRGRVTELAEKFSQYVGALQTIKAPKV